MRKLKLFKSLLVVATLLVGGTSLAWGETTTVGATDNSANWYTAFSDYYTLGANQTLTLNFKNYSSKAQNYHNWVAYVVSDADRGASGYQEYIALRADNYGWGNRWQANNLTSDYNWTTFKDDMDGSDVELTVTRNGALVTLHADITTSGSVTYHENYYSVCGSGTQNIRVFLTVDHAHLTNITSNIADNGNTSTSTGAGKELAFIDFSNAISEGAVAGQTNSMTVPTTGNYIYELGYTSGNPATTTLGDVLRVGNGSGTVTIPNELLADVRDEIIISFDYYFGALSGKKAGFYLYDNEATPNELGYYQTWYNNGSAVPTINSFGIAHSGKITSVGSSNTQNDKICVATNKTTFVLRLNYATGKMYATQYTDGVWKQETAPADMGTFGKLKQFVIKSDYQNNDRRCWFDNLHIYSIRGDYSVSDVDYTINYKLGDDVVKTINDTKLNGAVITAETAIDGEGTFAGNHYLITAADAPTMTLNASAAENVLNVSVRAPYTATLNLTSSFNGVDDTPVATVFTETDDKVCTWSYKWSIYTKKGSSFYKADDTSKFYESGTFTNGETINKKVSYTLDADVVGFSEVGTGSNPAYSGGGNTSVTSNLAECTVDAGNYRAEIMVISKAGNGSNHRGEGVFVGDAKDPVVSTTNNDDKLWKLDFNVAADNTNVFVRGIGSSNYGDNLDYVVIRKLPSTVSATIGANGYSTFASPYALDLTEAAQTSAGVKAYKAAVSGTTVTFTELNQTVPANTGILLEGTAGADVNLIVAASGTAVEGNDFLVNTTGATFSAGDYTYYAMIKATTADESIVFGTFNPGTLAIPANKAYLRVAGTNARLTVVFGDEATGIKTVQGAGVTDNGYYDLQGRRVAQPAKGLYIVNGKKMVVK